jgi:Ca2+-binding RTX toxin-like protein
VAGNSHYDDSIDTTPGRPAGNSRVYGDADPEVQLSSIDAIITAGRNANLSDHDIAYILTIALVESGFNPDAAAGTTSASGLGQFVDGTGLSYGIDDTNRWDVDAQAEALVNEYINLKAQVAGNSQGEEYIYAYHHDGPNASNPVTGLGLSTNRVMPRIADFEHYLENPVAPADLDPAPTVVPWPTLSPLPLAPGDWIPLVLSPFNGAVPLSPLVLDLGTGGINVSALNGSSAVYWDIDQDGIREASGWIAGNSALLAIDKNSNGVIDDNGELFGNNATYANGFANLAQYDSNTDGHITSADTQFSNLRVWTDDNHDGYSESTELHTLSSLSITDISLTYSGSSSTINGNQVKQIGTFTMGGNSHTIADVWFAYDNVNAEYAQDYTLDIRTLFLTDFRGYGALPDLHIAMSNDEDLLEAVQDLEDSIDLTALDSLLTLEADFTQILYQWAGVDGLTPSSRGGYIDARSLGFLETLLDTPFVGVGNTTSPPGPASAQLSLAYYNAYEALLGRMLAQTDTGDLFTDKPIYDLVSDSFSGTFELNVSAVEDLLSGSAQGAADQEVLQQVMSLMRIIDSTVGIANLSSGDADDIDDALDAFDPYHVFTVDALAAAIAHMPYSTLSATSGNDILIDEGNGSYISAGNGNDLILGNAGADSINGEGGSDVIVGGSGHDSLAGGTGDDTYVFNPGDSPAAQGGDSISENTSEGTDTIVLHEVDPDDVRMWSEGSSVAIQYASGDILNIYAGTGGGGESLLNDRIERMVFDDSTVWDLTLGLRMVDTSDGHTLNGTGDNDYLSGQGGNDTLYGYGGADTLIGGTGSNYLYGGSGADIFAFEAVTGSDWVGDFSTGQGDKLDVSSLIEAYDPLTNAITDFVRITDNGTSSTLAVDIDGAGTTHSFTDIATIYNVIGLTDEAALETAGTLITV